MEPLTGIEPASPAWKAGALAIVLQQRGDRVARKAPPPAFFAPKVPLVECAVPVFPGCHEKERREKRAGEWNGLPVELVDGLEPPTC